jgi:hypothetical protein
MTGNGKKQDRATRRIQEVLERHYLPAHPEARLDVYRYNSGIIRLRVVDPAFAARRLTDRDDDLWAVLKAHLDKDTLDQLHMVILLAPSELADSMMNREFESPQHSSAL